MPTLPVTVLSGFLGAGKTTLVNHLLRHGGGRRFAVIVNDLAEVNFDGMQIRSGRTSIGGGLPGPNFGDQPPSSSLGAAHAQARSPQALGAVVELHNGCICCTRREEFIAEVSRLARSGRFDALLVEATGVAEPLPIAMAFDQEDDQGELLGSVAHIDSMVTVVDARNFLDDWEKNDDLERLGLAVDALDNRTIADLLAEQVEFATQVVINKADLVSPEELLRLRRIVECLNPEAEIIESMFGMVEVEEVLGRDLYEQSQNAPVLEPGDALEEELGIGSFVYRARRPFHPERLWNCLHESWPGVMRSKGLFWLATRMNDSGLWSQAGKACSHQSAGRWWSSVSRELWPDDENIKESIESECQGQYGDRRQEIVVIGVHLDEALLRAKLDACLLDDSEMQMGPMGWTQLTDPFPAWEPDDLDETDLVMPVQRRQTPLA